jgi:signal transduction histidine kinase
MGSTPESPAAPRALPVPREEAGFPFRGPGLLARVAPFAVVAALAQASVLLPPGVRSVPAAVVSAVLLAATGGLFALPWTRLPGWLMALVPLTYTGSVLALILAAGATSGVGVAILIPLVWTALFHRPWESACVVVAVVTVEVITSLVPTADTDAVIARRVLLWGLLGALISVATHGLRDRIARSQRETALLQERLREVTVMQDRDRIATGLQDEVIQRVFAAGLALQSAASLTGQPEVQGRVEAAARDLDRVVRLLRDTVFGLGRRTRERGLRQEILDLCGGLSPMPEVSFAGPLDRALSPATMTRLAGVLRAAVPVVGQRADPASIAVSADEEECLAVIETVSHPAPADGEADRGWADGEPAGLRELATLAGARISIERIPGGGTRFAWHLPLATRSAVAKPDPGGALRGSPEAR